MEKTYLEECTECIPLPAVFPKTCLPTVVAALRGKIDDPKCVLHCALTIQAWACGLWINGVPSPGPAPMQANHTVDFLAAADQLEFVGGDGMKAGAVNWKVLIQTILALVQQLLSQS